MPPTPTRPAGASGLPWWLAPAAVGVLAVGGALSWVYFQRASDAPAPGPPPGSRPDSIPSVRRALPQPPKGVESRPVHWVGHGVENGVKVVYIQTVPGGDIMVVDAATGRLIESRPTVKPG